MTDHDPEDESLEQAYSAIQAARAVIEEAVKRAQVILDNGSDSSPHLVRAWAVVVETTDLDGDLQPDGITWAAWGESTSSPHAAGLFMSALQRFGARALP